MQIDLYNPASFHGGHPIEQYAWLQQNAPVHRQSEPDGPGYWAVTRWADIQAIGRDPETFSSEPTIMIGDPDPASVTSDDSHKMMLMMDPPMHTAYRKLISREFTQGPSSARGPRFTELSRQIVDAVIDKCVDGKGECDFVSEIAGELPSYVIAELMGIPLDDGRKLYELTEILHTSPEALPEGAQAQAGAEMFAYAMQVIKEKRANPGDDLASRLLHEKVDGRTLDDIDFQLFFLLLIDAGGDTTRNLVAGGLLALLEHPQQLAALQNDIDKHLVNARNELLRWVSPVIYMRRTVTRDTQIADQAIKAGDKVVMYYGAANRDPSVFDAPNELRIDRQPNPHIAFGGGTHVCLGQHIARVEIDALLREVFTRMHNIELAEPPQWLPSNFICGPKSMPIRFTANK